MTMRKKLLKQIKKLSKLSNHVVTKFPVILRLNVTSFSHFSAAMMVSINKTFLST